MVVDSQDFIETYRVRGFVEVPALFTSLELQPLIDRLDHDGASPGGFTVPDSEGNRQALVSLAHCS